MSAPAKGHLARDVEFVGYTDLAGKSGFKLAMQESNGRFYLYVAALWEPGLSIVDVTDPTQPRLVRWIDGPPATWTLQVQVADGKMITNLEPIPGRWAANSEAPVVEPLTGIQVWDVEDPESPTLLSTWDSGSNGTHRNFYAGGRYVHVATGQPGFDGRLYGIVDIDDPSNPRLISRWWYPGQHTAAGETYSAEDEAKRISGRPFGEAFSLHGGPYVVGDRVYCPWSRAGMIVLDISDIMAPTLVSRLSVYPPLGSSIAVHTVLPIPDRSIAVINDEALQEDAEEPANFVGIVDLSDPGEPMLTSLFPPPEVPAGQPDDFFFRGGRFGPHNQHQPQGQPSLLQNDTLTYLTYFNAGLQIYDTSDPRRPRNVGYYIPPDPPERLGPLPSRPVAQVEDVLVDRRGYAYFTEKSSGVTIVRYEPRS